MNSRRIDFACIYFDFGSFSQKTSPQIDTIQKTPRGSPTPQKGGQKMANGWAKGHQGDPKRESRGAQSHPRRPKGVPLVAQDGQREAKGTQRQPSPKSSQRKPKAPQRHPREAKGSQRDKIYIYKLPINRPSKRYVSIFHICCI